MSLTNYENFWDEAKLYMHSRPKAADSLGYIIEDPKDPVLQAWKNYAVGKGWEARARTWGQMVASGCKLTMPCANPDHFDMACSKNTRAA